MPVRDSSNTAAEEAPQRPTGPVAQYDFEPSPEEVLDALLPRYVGNLVYNALLQSAASEHAARRRAMKAATDNADDLIEAYTREANTARQAQNHSGDQRNRRWRERARRCQVRKVSV